MIGGVKSEVRQANLNRKILNVLGESGAIYGLTMEKGIAFTVDNSIRSRSLEMSYPLNPLNQ